MEAKKFDRMRLFGVDIVVPRDDDAAADHHHHPDDHNLMINSGIGSLRCNESGLFLLQENPNDEQSSDENSDASASPGLFTAGSSSASKVSVEEKEKPAFAMKDAEKVDFSVSRKCYDCRVDNPVPLRCIPPDITQETGFSRRPPTQELDEKGPDISASNDEDMGLYSDSPYVSRSNVDETIEKYTLDSIASVNRCGCQIYNPMPLRCVPLTESSYSDHSSPGLVSVQNVNPLESEASNWSNGSVQFIKRQNPNPVTSNSRPAKRPRIKPYNSIALQDTWPYKKKLQHSDVDGSSRFLVSKEYIRASILTSTDERLVQDCQTKDGTRVVVRDEDTGTNHSLILKTWATRSFVLTSNWTDEFVKRRKLEGGDVVGLRWDQDGSMFHFKLLERASQI